MPHFGLAVTVEQFEAIAARVRGAGIKFIIEARCSSSSSSRTRIASRPVEGGPFPNQSGSRVFFLRSCARALTPPPSSLRFLSRVSASVAAAADAQIRGRAGRAVHHVF